MKKKYAGMNMVVIPFDMEDTIVTSVPSSCFQIVANTVAAGTQVCSNPTDTTSHMWYGDNPYE